MLFLMALNKWTLNYSMYQFDTIYHLTRRTNFLFIYQGFLSEPMYLYTFFRHFVRNIFFLSVYLYKFIDDLNLIEISLKRFQMPRVIINRK